MYICVTFDVIKFRFLKLSLIPALIHKLEAKVEEAARLQEHQRASEADNETEELATKLVANLDVLSACLS